MLSYKEKQLLMVQKYLLDRTQSSYFKIEKLMLQSGPAPKASTIAPSIPILIILTIWPHLFQNWMDTIPIFGLRIFCLKKKLNS